MPALFDQQRRPFARLERQARRRPFRAHTATMRVRATYGAATQKGAASNFFVFARRP